MSSFISFFKNLGRNIGTQKKKKKQEKKKTTTKSIKFKNKKYE
jgi:hypothetical protein